MTNTRKGNAPPPAQQPPAPPPQQPPAPPTGRSREEEVGLAFRDYLAKRSDLIARMVRPGSVLNAMLLIRCAELVYRGKDQGKLQNEKTWPSVLTALMTAAQLDLEVGGALGEAYLVPYYDKDFKGHLWSLMPGYRGLVKLACQSKAVKRMRAFVVYQRDEFRIEQGSEDRIVHVPYLDEDRGPERGVYAIARMADGEDEYEWVPAVDVQRIRAAAQDTSPAWRDWPDQMARKSAIKRLAKQLPAGANFSLAVAVDHAAEIGDTAALRTALASAGIQVDGFNQGQLAAPQKSAADQVLDKIINGARKPAGVEVASKGVVPPGAKDANPKRAGWPDDPSDDVPNFGGGQPVDADLQCPRCAAPVDDRGLCEACANE